MMMPGGYPQYPVGYHPPQVNPYTQQPTPPPTKPPHELQSYPPQHQPFAAAPPQHAHELTPQFMTPPPGELPPTQSHPWQPPPHPNNAHELPPHFMTPPPGELHGQPQPHPHAHELPPHYMKPPPGELPVQMPQMWDAQPYQANELPVPQPVVYNNNNGVAEMGVGRSHVG